jgi:16S rRNA (uracil1498-N3)-methyltransferase
VSTPRRLFVRQLPPMGGDVALDRAAMRHARVLRLSIGEEVLLFDGSGHEADATIVGLTDDGMVCRADVVRRVSRTAPPIFLCQCLPKGRKLEDIVRACTELGVAGVHLATSERSVPRLDPTRAEARLERLVRVAREAARQSQRATVPDLHAPAPLAEVLTQAPVEAARLAFVVDGDAALEDACPPDAASAWIVIGPEGGLSESERALAKDAGFFLVGLGPGVLRVETAASVALALIAHRLGRLRPGA